MHFFYQIHTHDLFACRCDHLAYTPHVHAHLELLYVTKGAMDVTVDGQSERLHTGDLAVIFPHTLHSFETLPEPEGSGEEIVVLVIHPRLTGDYADQVISTRPSCPFVRKDRMAPDMTGAIDQLLSYSQLLYPERFHPSIAKSYAQLLMARLWPLLQVVPNVNAKLDNITYQAAQYMMQHFREPLTLESVAEHLSISKRQLSRLFSETIRIGFHEYLLDLRTEHAKGLLSHTDMPITEVSFQSGFESQRTFNRAFRDFYGMSPREYRKSLTGQPGSSPGENGGAKAQPVSPNENQPSP